MPFGTGRCISLQRASPFGVAANPVTNKVYVANAGCCANLGRNVSVIDGATDTVIATIDFGLKVNPIGVAVNPATNKIYVGDLGPSAPFGKTVSIIDGSTDTIVAA